MSEEILKIPAAIAGLYIFARFIGFLDATERFYDFGVSKDNSTEDKEKMRKAADALSDFFIELLARFCIVFGRYFLGDLILKPLYCVFRFIGDAFLYFLPEKEPEIKPNDKPINVSGRKIKQKQHLSDVREFFGIPKRRILYSDDGSIKAIVTYKCISGAHFSGMTYNSVIVDSYSRIDSGKYTYQETLEVVLRNDKVIALHNGVPYYSWDEKYAAENNISLLLKFVTYAEILAGKAVDKDIFLF